VSYKTATRAVIKQFLDTALKHDFERDLKSRREHHVSRLERDIEI